MPSLNAQILAHLAGCVALWCALMLLRDYGRRWLNRHERAPSSSFWGRLRHHPQPVRFAAGRALWWLALGPLAAVPYPLSGARPVRRKYVDVFIGWRDRLSQRLAGLAESLWERRS